MAKTGTQVKSSALKQRREATELELIIEKFARAMRNANKLYIARPPQCQHDGAPRFTCSMEAAWAEYVWFCMNHPE